MGFTEVLRLLVEADTKGAGRNVEAFGTKVEREASKATSNLDKVGAGLTKARLGMVTFGAVALVGLGHAAMASEEAEASTRKLQNSVANNPRLNAASAQSFIHLAEAIQDKTAADADDIIAGEAVLAQGKLTADQMRTLIPLVVDLARKKGLDEVAAFTMASKAADGNAGALKRAGIQVDEARFKTDAYGATVEALKGSVGGFAEEEGKTFAGSLERMKNELGDLEEGVGKGAVDAFTSLFGVVDGLSGKLNDLSPGAQETIGKFATYGSVALIAAGATSTLIGQVIKARQNFGAAVDALSSLKSNMSGIVGPAARFGLAIGALSLIGQTIDEISGGIKGLNLAKLENDLLRLGQTGKASSSLLEAAGGDLDKLKNAVERIAAPSLGTQFHNVEEEISTLGGLLGETGHDLEEDKQIVDDFDKALARLASRNPKLAAEALQQLTDQMNPEEAHRFVGLLDDYDAALAEIDTSEATQGTSDLGGAMSESGDSTEDATSALQDYQDAIQAMTDPIFAAMDALTGVRDAQLGLDDANRTVLESQLTLDKAIRDHGRDSDEAHEATRGLEDAHRGLTDAQWGTVDAAANADSALAALTDAVDRGDVSVDDFNSTLRQWVRQGFLTQDQANKAAISVGGLAHQAEVADSKRVEIPVGTSGFGRAMSNLATLGQRVSGIDGRHATVTIDFQSTGFGSLATQLATLGIGHRAAGGPVRAGRLYEVAEGDRAELLEMAGRTYLIPGSDGQVVAAGAGTIPAPAFAATGGGPSGQLLVRMEDHRTTVTLNGQQIAEMIRQDQALNYGRQSVRIR